jgi:hypothetical protein
MRYWAAPMLPLSEVVEAVGVGVCAGGGLVDDVHA